MLDKLFSTLNEHEISEFCKEYAVSHPDFAADMEKYFAKNTTAKLEKVTPESLKKELDGCFKHYYGGPQWYGKYYNDYEPDYNDWEAVGEDLGEFLGKLNDLIDDGQAALALENTLLALEKIGKEFDNEYGYDREDIDYDDFHTYDALDLIIKAFDSEQLDKKTKLDTVSRLETISKYEAFQYDDYGFNDLIETTRNQLMTDDERIKLRMDEFELSDNDYWKEIAAEKVWDYLMNLGRQQQAVDFYNENSNINGLRSRYVKYLEENGRFNEALETLNTGLKNNSNKVGIILGWEREKLVIFEKLNNKPNIINQLQLLFIDDSNPVDRYRQLKTLIPADEWPTFLRNLLKKRDFGISATSALSEIYELEGWFDELYKNLMTLDFDLFPAIIKYVHHFDDERQKKIIARLEIMMKNEMEYPRKRNEYADYTSRLIKLCGVCPAGKASADKIVNYCRQNFKNRPAMLDELKKYDRNNK